MTVNAAGAAKEIESRWYLEAGVGSRLVLEAKLAAAARGVAPQAELKGTDLLCPTGRHAGLVAALYTLMIAGYVGNLGADMMGLSNRMIWVATGTAAVPSAAVAYIIGRRWSIHEGDRVLGGALRATNDLDAMRNVFTNTGFQTTWNNELATQLSELHEKTTPSASLALKAVLWRMHAEGEVVVSPTSTADQKLQAQARFNCLHLILTEQPVKLDPVSEKTWNGATKEAKLSMWPPVEGANRWAITHRIKGMCHL